MKFTTPDNTRDPDKYRTYTVHAGFGDTYPDDYKDMEFIEYSSTQVNGDSGWVLASANGASMLKERRNQLGLTQQQVANLAGIQIAQYQKFESGERDIHNATMRIGLSILAVLKLFPYEVLVDAIRSNKVTAMSGRKTTAEIPQQPQQE